ncbi:phosphoribosylanthranilate isomerase [Pilibacter termitis]|uniref:N-(5'-phosphoribosyl)anthranilate isomerase n=1 Tax=Pilibacter termitis TaxID=263852 RepID=A0A1T4QDF1_9ENTE|nr:phosphoribosylanthranilate isomerase [Pilibacter termitis]SKA01268.1 phosphoribosylanthranilate isomerase [Pilibacter termitis]
MLIKICGLKTQEAVQAAVENGATHIGFVFAKSKRKITKQQARSLAKLIPDGIVKVGLFVDEDLTKVKELIEEVPLDMVQLHGSESIDYANEINVPILKAFSVEEGKLPEGIKEFHEHTILLDAPSGKFAGGNGERFEWEKVDVSQLSNYQFFIAGGLTSENVVQAIQYFHPTGVDVSSGVEVNGEKNIRKIKDFIQTVKNNQLKN